MIGLLALSGFILLLIGIILWAVAHFTDRATVAPKRVLGMGLFSIIWSILLSWTNLHWSIWILGIGALLLIAYVWRRKGRRSVPVDESPASSLPSTPATPATVAKSAIDYNEVREEVAALKREGRHSEALNLLGQEMEATERSARDSGQPVKSWSYQQAAIIYRKQKEYDSEVAVLERFARQPNSSSKQSRTLLKRLAKAYVLAGEAGDVADGERMPLLMAQAVLIDCETTGFSRRDEIIDLALLVFEYSRATGEVFGVVDQYAGLREPRLSIPPDATAVHGLTDSDVRGQRLDEGKCRSLFDAADVLVAHNVGFDRRMVAALFPEVQSKTWLCSMNGVKWKAKGHSSKALQSLLSDFEIVPDTAHRALADAQATLQLISQVDPDTGDTYVAEMLDRPAGNSR